MVQRPEFFRVSGQTQLVYADKPSKLVEAHDWMGPEGLPESDCWIPSSALLAATGVASPRVPELV